MFKGERHKDPVWEYFLTVAENGKQQASIWVSALFTRNLGIKLGVERASQNAV